MPMDAPPKAFRYALAPVLRRDTWERDLLAAELVRAQILAEQCRKGLQAAQAALGAAEASMRELHQQDRTIALEARRLLHDYLKQAHVTAAERGAESDRASALLAQLREQFESKQVAVRALQTHRDRQQQDHDAEQGRQAQNAADALWLMREKPQ
jgi:hypothetical protein